MGGIWESKGPQGEERGQLRVRKGQNNSNHSGKIQYNTMYVTFTIYLSRIQAQGCFSVGGSLEMDQAPSSIGQKGDTLNVLAFSLISSRWGLHWLQLIVQKSMRKSKYFKMQYDVHVVNLLKLFEKTKTNPGTVSLIIFNRWRLQWLRLIVQKSMRKLKYFLV